MRDEYDMRGKYLVGELNRIGLECFQPQGAFYVFPSIRRTGLSSEEFCERLLREERVAVIHRFCFWRLGRRTHPYFLLLFAAASEDRCTQDREIPQKTGKGKA